MQDDATPRPDRASDAAPGDGAGERVPHDHRRRPRRGRTRRHPAGWWRVGTPVVVVVCAGLAVVSAQNSEGTDLRPGRYPDLASLVGAEAEQVQEQQARVRELDDEVAGLTRQTGDRTVDRYNERIERLSDPAGMTPVTGAGLTITLSDAPEAVRERSTENPNRLVVHQQDIQAVVNALWRAGAEAVTIKGKRIITTTGIKCEGNSVQLDGVPYPQPYTISAVGDQAALLGSLDRDAYLAAYREDSAKPDIAVGWDVSFEQDLQAPAYAGVVALDHARPLG